METTDTPTQSSAESRVAMLFDVKAMIDSDDFEYGPDYNNWSRSRAQPTDSLPPAPAAESPDAGRTFHLFPDLPAELRRMIWREFYLEPRYFIVGDYDGGFHEDPEHPNASRLWIFDTTWYMTPYSRCVRYWRSVDTSIDRMSRDVAHGVRDRVWFPLWARAYEMDTDLGSLPWRDPERHPSGRRFEYPADTRINWDVDWTRICSPRGYTELAYDNLIIFPITDWWANIRNLATHWSFPCYTGFLHYHRGISDANMSLWVCCQRMPALEAVRAVVQPSYHPVYARLVEMLSSISHFQRLHLLRQESCANSHIRGVRVDVVFSMPGVSWPPSWSRLRTLMSKARFMKEFEGESGRGLQFYLKGMAQDFADVELSEDEVEGSGQLFCNFDLRPVQAVVRSLDEWMEHRHDFDPRL